MSKLLNFKNLLLFSSAMVNFSGFTAISIDSKTFEFRKSIFGLSYFALSFMFSCFAVSANYYLPVALITRSMILEVIVNVLNSLIIRSAFMFKIINLLNQRTLWKIFKDLQWTNKKVKIFFFCILKF